MLLLTIALSKEVNINAQTAEGMTALHLAVQNNHIGVVRYLYPRNADLEAVDSFGRTVLHLAVWKGYVSLCRYLLSIGANVNAFASGGYTPLPFAACLAREMGYTPCAELINGR